MRPLRTDRTHNFKAWILDIETTGLGEPVSRQAVKGRPPYQLICVLYDGVQFIRFWGKQAIQEAIDFVISEGVDAEIFAHYGGGFDFRFAHGHLFKRVKESGSGWNVVTSGSFVIVCAGKIDGIKLRLVDSYRLLPGSLKAIGEAVGYEKGAWEHNWHDDQGTSLDPSFETKKRFRLHAPICYEKLAEYCERDCLVLWKGLKQIRDFAATQGISLRNTIASTASASIRRKLNLDTIAWAPQEVTDVALKACFGGRTEPFDRDCREAAVFDIQSSYPAAMLRMLPWRYLETRTKYRARMIGIVEAAVSVPKGTAVPVLPFRMKEGKDKGRVFFPTGEWRGTFVGTELDHAVKCGAKILEVTAFHRFEGGDVLGHFARTIWKERRRAIGFRRYALKIWLNAVYGKLNEDPDHENIVVHPPTDLIICERHREVPRELDEKPCACKTPIVPAHGLYAFDTHHDPAFHAPWAAAAITAIARVNLHKFFLEALEKGGNLYYCDTDSITTNAELGAGIELGELKLERRIADGRFIGPKMYAYKCIQCDEKQKCKACSEVEEHPHEIPKKHPHDIIKAKGFTKLSRADFEKLDHCVCGATGYRGGTAFGCPLCNGGSLQKPGTGRGVHDFERTEGFKEALARGRLEYRRIKVKRQLRDTRGKRHPSGRPWDVSELSSASI